MRRGLLVVVCMLAIVAMPLCGVGGAGAGEPLKLRFIGASPGGVFYMVMTGIAECIKRSVPGSVVTLEPGESASNIVRIQKGDGDIGLTQGAVAAWAMKGLEPFKEPTPDIRALVATYRSGVQFVVLRETGLTSIEDIKNRKYPLRISIGPPGSVHLLTNTLMLAEYGITLKDIESWGGKVFYKEMEESSDMMSNGLLDALSIQTLYPASSIQELAMNKDVVMLPIKDSVVRAMTDKYGYGPWTIKAGAYKFVQADVPSFASTCILFAKASLADDVAYKIVKAVAENLDYFRTVHTAFKDMTVESMAQNTGIPLHPGAEKYYREVGAIK